MVWVRRISFLSSTKKKANISVNVRALPASLWMLRKSDVICSLSAGRHRAENDKWSVTLPTIFNFSKPNAQTPHLDRVSDKSSAISYSNRHTQLSTAVRKQTLCLSMGLGVMNTGWFCKRGDWWLFNILGISCVRKQKKDKTALSSFYSS